MRSAANLSEALGIAPRLPHGICDCLRTPPLGGYDIAQGLVHRLRAAKVGPEVRVNANEITGPQVHVVPAARDASEAPLIRDLRHLGERLVRGLRGRLRRFVAHG